MKIQSIALLLAVFANTTLAASEHQALSDIHDIAREFAQQRVQAQAGELAEVKVSKLDRRLKLAVCLEGLETFEPAGSKFPGRGTVGVRCLGPSHWKVYVSVKVDLYKKVVVARQYLSKGSVINESHLTKAMMNTSQLRRGYFLQPDALLGKVLKRSIGAGKAITPAGVKQVIAVKRGEMVSVVVSRGGLTVSSKGKALQSGSVGERVRIRNSRTDKEIEGVISAPGRVRIGF